MISEAAIKIPAAEANINATIENHVFTNAYIDTSRTEPCDHEEADTRLLLHVLDGSSTGIRRISIVTVDTDVVILALRQFVAPNLDEFWVEFEVEKYRRYIWVNVSVLD